jgi:hypothetical protein
MRRIALVLSLVLLTATASIAADGAGEKAVDFAKRVVLKVQAAKDKDGAFPTSVKVMGSDGKEIEVKVTVTPLAEGYSIKITPPKGAPISTCNVDVNASGSNGDAIVSLVGTADDGSDVVAFATTGTELAVTVTKGDVTTNFNTTTSVADVAAQGDHSSKPSVTVTKQDDQKSGGVSGMPTVDTHQPQKVAASDLGTDGGGSSSDSADSRLGLTGNSIFVSSSNDDKTPKDTSSITTQTVSAE